MSMGVAFAACIVAEMIVKVEKPKKVFFAPLQTLFEQHFLTD
jgi:ERCC4-related helicase